MTRACPLCAAPNDPQAAFCAACGSPLEALAAEPTALADGFGPLPANTLVRDGSLVLVQVLGQGGFGITYRAREFSSGRTVAVKELFPFGCVRVDGVVTPSTLLDADAWQASREGFRREGALLSGHAHPNVVQVLDVWDERGTTFLAMEFLDGQTLAQVLEEKGALGVRRVRAMIEQMGGALALLHAAGMLHRDIKPENIMLCPASGSATGVAGASGTAGERWVLLDFGAARAFATGKSLSLTQIVSPGYAPLEQYASRARGGPPSDIYALAATAYHALTGAAPPPATERAGHDDLQAPESLNPNIPRALSQAIVRALSLRVDQRPQNIQEWLRELDGAPTAPQAPALSPFASPIPPVPPGTSLDGRLMRPEPSPAPQGRADDAADRFGGAMEVFERVPSAPPLAPASTSGLSGGAERGGVSLQAFLPSFEMAHGAGDSWYRVTVESRRIQWPRKCACCGDGTMVLPMDVRTPAIWWQLPYCAACREHAEKGESITTAANMLAVIAFVLGLAFLLFEAIRPGMGLWLAAAGLKAGSSLLQAGLFAAHRARTVTPCCGYGPAARFKERSGNRYVWEFRSLRFAEEFCALNGGDVNVPSVVATGETSTGNSSSSRQRVST